MSSVDKTKALLLEAEKIFAQTIELDRRSREEYLNQACADWPELREEVESLLAEADRDQSLLFRLMSHPVARIELAPSPALEESLQREQRIFERALRCEGEKRAAFLEASYSPREQAAKNAMEQRLADLRIGPYRILREIGRGGMGIVYQATHEEVHGELLAIKVLDHSRSDLVERFQVERQTLARLKHPNIASLKDGGTAQDGRPYLVMDYLEGEPIDQYCDHQQLSVSQRLALFSKVCSAVSFAQTKLVVHSDLKPGNILVTSEGEPMILDFGIVTLIDTQTPQSTPIGTPGYASPEQLRGKEIDTASDVFSLGVVLYELLSGHRSFPVKTISWREALQTVEQTVVPQPSDVIEKSRQVRLEDGKRMTVSPTSNAANRCTSVRQLRRKLRGDLDAIVMKAIAKRPEDRYPDVATLATDLDRHLQLWPIMAREPSWLYRADRFVRRHNWKVASVVIIFFLITSAVFLLLVQQREIITQRDDARRQLTRAEKVTEFLIDIFEVSDPRRSDRSQITAEDLLVRGAERIASELHEQPTIRAALITALGRVYSELGVPEKARQLLEDGLTVRRGLAGDHQLELAESLHALGVVLRKLDQFEHAEQLMTEGLELRQNALGLEHALVAESMNDLGVLYHYQGRFQEAEAYYIRTMDLRQKILSPDDPFIAVTASNLGSLYYSRGEYEKVESYYRHALEIAEKIFVSDHPSLATYRDNLASFYSMRCEHARARPLYEAALEARRKRLGEENADVALSSNNLANLLLLQGEYDLARLYFDRSLKIRKKVLGEKHHRIADTLNSLGALHRYQGEYEEAEPYYQRALEIRRGALDAHHPLIAASFESLAGLRLRQQKPGEAETLLHQAIALREQGLGKTHSSLAPALNALAGLSIQLSEYDRAQMLFERSLLLTQEFLEKNPGHCVGQRRLAATHLGLGKLQLLTGQPGTRPQEHWQQALQAVPAVTEISSDSILLNTKALALLYLGRLGDAEPIVEKLRASGWHHPELEQLYVDARE